MAWRKTAAERFPAPLRLFREQDWPPVDGECLGNYGCRALGHEAACTPCGRAHYDMLAAAFPHRPGMLAAARTADAYRRWHQARLNWLGPGHPAWMQEFLASREHEIRYAPLRRT